MKNRKTFGKRWRDEVKRTELRVKESKAEKKRRMYLMKKAAVLAMLTARMEEALCNDNKPPDSLMLYGPIRSDDVPHGKVDQLWEKAYWRWIISSDVVGIAKDVVEWCMSEDLPCLFVKANLDSHKYYIAVRLDI